MPSDWALKPSEVSAGGKFRLIFMSSTLRNATSSNIADYNRFVQGEAAAGHASIQPFKGGFRAVASTEAVDARDNTCSTGIGVRIHWLNGSKVADNYGDFYDGGWDNETNPRRANGSTQTTRNVWTGSSNNGTEAFDGSTSLALGGGGAEAAFGLLNHGPSGPLSSGTTTLPKSRNEPLYGLSQVFKVLTANEEPRATAITIPDGWAPASGDTYHLGDTIEFEVTYSEAVDVRGTPKVGLAVSTHDRNFLVEFEAVYVRGSGTNKLVFAWDVSDRAKDSDGIQTFTNTLRLNGATITAMSDGFPAVWHIPPWRQHRRQGRRHADGLHRRGVRPDARRCAPPSWRHCPSPGWNSARR